MWQQIEKQLQGQLPLVVYRKPGQEEVNSIFQRDDALHYLSHFSKKGFVFAPFDPKSAPLFIKGDASLAFQFSETEPAPYFDKNFEYSEAGRDDYLDLLEKAIDDIEAGKFRKVVLSRVLEVENSTTPITLLKRILSIYKNAFCYLWYHPKVGMWLGATPEILLQSNGSFFSTMSLAGTMKYERIARQDWGTKELEEQSLVTEYILTALQDKVSDLEKSARETVRAGELLHLRTKITGTLKDDGLNEIVHALHPTPAVCGLPKIEALNFILNNEGYERKFYAGYLGELNLDSNGSTTLYVNLRCMQKIDRKIKIYVGGGVTKDSNPEKEWQETQNKSGTMLRVLIGKN
ncbi:MAG: isochorismate synthase [Aurantibacter sp.]